MTDDLLPAAILEPDPPLSDAELEAFDQAVTHMGATVAEVVADAGDLESSDASFRPMVDRVRHWQIDGDRTAAWSMAKLAAAEADHKELAALRDEYHAQVDGWFAVEASRRRLPSTIAYFRSQLERWGLRVREESDGKRKSVALPSGEVKTTQSAAKIVVTNEPEFLLWARKTLSDEQWEAVTTEPRVSLTGMRGLVSVVEIVDAWSWVASPCGCVNGLGGADLPLGELPAIGTAFVCGSCTDDALVGSIEVHASHHEARWGHIAVPGLAVEEAKVSAKVVV